MYDCFGFFLKQASLFLPNPDEVLSRILLAGPCSLTGKKLVSKAKMDSLHFRPLGIFWDHWGSIDKNSLLQSFDVVWRKLAEDKPIKIRRWPLSNFAVNYCLFLSLCFSWLLAARRCRQSVVPKLNWSSRPEVEDDKEMKKSVYAKSSTSSHAPRQPVQPKMKQQALDSRAKLQVHGFKCLSDIKDWWRDAGGRPWAKHSGEPLKGKPLSATSLQVQVSLCTEPGG